jgi:hypothetical protein
VRTGREKGEGEFDFGDDIRGVIDGDGDGDGDTGRDPGEGRIEGMRANLEKTSQGAGASQGAKANQVAKANQGE